jgi:hypothetical protein
MCEFLAAFYDDSVNASSSMSMVAFVFFIGATFFAGHENMQQTIYIFARGLMVMVNRNLESVLVISV